MNRNECDPEHELHKNKRNQFYFLSFADSKLIRDAEWAFIKSEAYKIGDSTSITTRQSII